ncbi:hypothetical protein BpHYR1_036999 [Brachionus plicatilis]|uniref:Uncharacterized protein n=1 Tax=Brachionus plicatilis TaxID=10195 RepID=A0A3M7SXS4_BRAPC|nr:hypothetical protein BpHYR1_036999 [Brachionus plicatilis]
MISHEWIKRAQLHPSHTQFLICVTTKAAYVRANLYYAEHIERKHVARLSPDQWAAYWPVPPNEDRVRMNGRLFLMMERRALYVAMASKWPYKLCKL